MSKITIDELLNKIPNRYLLATIAGKKYRKALKECNINNIYISHDKLTEKVSKEIIEEFNNKNEG